MDWPYLRKVLLLYSVLIGLLVLNGLFGGVISEGFRFVGNLSLIVVAAISILVLLFKQLKVSRGRAKGSAESAKSELVKEIQKRMLR